MKINAVRETIEVETREHLITLVLSDETKTTEGSCNYEFHLEPNGAMALAQQLMGAVERLLPEHYNTPIVPLDFLSVDFWAPEGPDFKEEEPTKQEMSALFGEGDDDAS